LLTDAMADQLRAGLADLAGVVGVRTWVRMTDNGAAVGPALLALSAATFREHSQRLLDEHFGPASLVVEYDHPSELPTLAGDFSGSLTATVHAEPAEEATMSPLLEVLARIAGRIIWNGWPTGVTVSPAMHHGGPFPATTASLHTSVGLTSIRIWTSPSIGSQVRPRLCSIAISAAFSPCSGVPRALRTHWLRPSTMRTRPLLSTRLSHLRGRR
jgi:NADP-dependent aldehyde dehydrogenase